MSQRTRSWNSQSSTCRCTGGRELRVTEGGKVLSRRQSKLQPLQHEETVRQHDQCQMPTQAIEVSPLEVVQATFLLGIFVTLLDDPARMCQGDQSFQRGVWGQGREPVLRLVGFCFSCCFLLGRSVRWHWLGGGRLLILGCG